MIDNDNKVKNIIRISIAVIICLLLIIIYIALVNKNQKKRIKDRLKKIGYEEITESTYNKKDDKTSYNFNLKTKEFSKTINIKSESEIKTIIISTENKEKINIYYKYQNNDLCKIIQKGTYENKKFNCDIKTKTGSCKAKCDEMYDEIKEFQNNYNDLIKKIK
ncbi:MAG: hypothetical protein IKF82_08425 [Bacilli bacterium]|nr:hypothetical protein [Bacilli bacterium]